ncbi:MAG: YitT family protein [Prevotella sp.]|nr:YitT family protein [Prevotella sp.]
MQNLSIFKSSLLSELRDYVMIFIAMMSYCIGWNIFLLPNNITTGGVPGVSSIVFWATGIPVQWTYFAINAVLLLIALRVLGLKFCVKTIYAVVVLTVATTVVGDHYHGSLLSGQPFMAAVVGAVFCGCGVGLGLASNGSTGGTDIIAAIVNKYRDISLGRVILICDVIIISSSYLVLGDWEKVIYGYVVLYVTAFCLDRVVDSMRQSVQFFIISDRYREIGERINREPHRGCTIVDAQGFYSGKDVKMLFVLAKRRQSDLIFRIINDVDPTAFVSQSLVVGVYGEGFDRFKVRTRKGEKKE